MRRYKVDVEYTATTIKEMTIDIPNDMDEDELEEILSSATEYELENLDSFYSELQSNDIEIVSELSDTTDVPPDIELALSCYSEVT